MVTHLAPPPRRVPLSLAIANAVNGLAQIGCLFLVFGSLFFWGVVMKADYSFVTFHGARSHTTGKLQAVSMTGNRDGGREIVEYRYAFAAAGQPFTGVSYMQSATAQPGEQVAVEYLTRNPSMSRIIGMRRGMFGPSGMFYIIPALIGAAIVWTAMRQGMKQNRILRDGIFTTGVSERETSEPTVDFFGDAAAHLGNPKPPAAPGTPEPMLYDPGDRSRCYTLGELRRPEVDAAGDFCGRPVAAARNSIMPSLVLAKNVLLFLTHLGIDWRGMLR